MLAIIILRENAGNRLNRVVSMMLFFAGIAPFAAAIYKSVLEAIPGLPPWFVNIVLYLGVFLPGPALFLGRFPRAAAGLSASINGCCSWRFLPHIFHLLLVLLLSDPDKILGLLKHSIDTADNRAVIPTVFSDSRIIAAFVGFLLLIHKRFFSLVNLIYVSFALYFLYLGYKNIENPRLKQQVGWSSTVSGWRWDYMWSDFSFRRFSHSNFHRRSAI